MDDLRKNLKMNRGLERLEPLLLIRAWKESAGPALLKQARFLGLHPSTGTWVLKLEVADPVWRQELEFQTKLILQAFTDRLKGLGYAAHKFPTKVEITGGTVSKSTRPRKS